MKKYISLIISILLCLSLIGCSTNADTEELSSTSMVSESTINVAEASSTTKPTSSTTDKSTSAATTTAKATTTKTTAKTDTTAKPTETTTTTIECKTILGKMDKLKAGHESYVPANGIMLSSYSVTVKNGATAFDAVKQACGSNGISMNTTSSSYGYYIAGFNNIDEKDCGSTSGWTYYVNGSMPNKSCSKYAVKNGDSIVFSYTC